MKNIRLHKELNRKPIKFHKEIGIKFFKEVVYKFNQVNTLEGEIIISNQELRTLLNLRDTLDLKKFQKDFHDNDKGIFNTVLETSDGGTIGGGLFLTKVDGNQTNIKVRINPFWKDYFYSKLDIDQWHKAKGNNERIKSLECSQEEKIKLTNLMTTVINHNVKGKYSQRLMDLLNQFLSTGKFFMNWEEFKDVMEIPMSYKASNIDQQVFNPARKELLKIGLKITNINKIKKGRSIDRIEILFKLEKTEKIRKESNNGIEKTVIESKIMNVFGVEKNRLRIKLGKINKLKLNSELEKIETAEKLEEFKIKYEL
ncbi:MAG: replication initiation protein [Psychrilyobacter sp.]|uniref:replication initiation protein n=1 Tax=Psychrilyobacter sp. TaxID=2586924 RepID=UPI003C7262BF